MRKKRVVCVGFVFALAFCLAAEAKSCKWIDSAGEIHYGDKIPPAYADTDAAQAGNNEAEAGCASGASLKENGSKEDEAKQLAAKKEKEEKRRRANSLRSTYSNEQEIDIALERNTALISARIEAYDVQLKSAREMLDDLNRYVDGQRRAGRIIPQSAFDDISMAEARVARLQADRARSEEELKSMKARFEEDKIIYRKIIDLNPEEAEKSIAKPCNCPVLKDVDAYPDYSSSSYRSRKSRSRY